MVLPGRRTQGDRDDTGFIGLLSRQHPETLLHRLAAHPGRRFACGPVQLAGPGGKTFGDGVRHVFAFAGRLVNAHELTTELTAEPSAGMPVSDGRGRDGAGTALALLRHAGVGVGALAGFRGHFALAHWDATAARLWLAADHLGRRTVFYTQLAEGIAFASTLRALLALPGVARDLDEAYLAASFSDVPPDPEATPYAAIRRVPAASVLGFTVDGECTRQLYWQPDWGHRLRYRRDDEYVEQGRAVLDRVVARGMRGHDHILCQLSGGFDSGAVAATAARLHMPGRVHALTMAPPDDTPRFEHPTIFGDERPQAAAVAAMYPNMAWEALSSTGLHPLDENPLRLFLPLAMPARGALNVGWYAPLFERARNLGARTVLTGGLGNMTLSWDGLCGLASLARRGKWHRLWWEARALGKRQGLSVATILRRYAILPLLPPRLQARWQRWRGGGGPEGEIYSPIHPDFARSRHIQERRLDFGLDYLGDTDTTQRRWLLYVQSNAATADWTEVLFGVTSYEPLGDVDMVEFTFAMPEEQYLHDGDTRWLTRRILADRLPPAVLDETRRGFQCAEFLHRMTLQRDQIMEGVAALEHSPLACRILDVERIKRIAHSPWPTDASRTEFGDHAAILHRGLHYGQFLRWVEGGNR